jgi:outer membrane protein assembly factor BamB
MYRNEPAPAPLAIVAWNRNILALERMTGRRVWTFAEDATWSQIGVTNERVVALDGSSSPRMVCLAYATGAKLWEAPSKLSPADTLLIDGETILLSGSGEMACHSLADGRLLWHDPFTGMGFGRVSFGFPFNVADRDRR